MSWLEKHFSLRVQCYCTIICNLSNEFSSVYWKCETVTKKLEIEDLIYGWRISEKYVNDSWLSPGRYPITKRNLLNGQTINSKGGLLGASTRLWVQRSLILTGIRRPNQQNAAFIIYILLSRYVVKQFDLHSNRERFTLAWSSHTLLTASYNNNT